MVFDIIAGIIIFGYAGLCLYKHVKKSSKGKCAQCPLQENCVQPMCDMKEPGKNHQIK